MCNSNLQFVGSCMIFVISALLLPATVLSDYISDAGTLKVVYAVNAGGPEHIDRHGIQYEQDSLQTGIASDYGNNLLMIGRVPEPDEVLYRTERYHTSTFGYDLPINGDGNYALVMKFCEVYFNAPRMKVFDVMLNNRHTVVSKLDIFQQVGHGTAHDEIVYFKVNNGRLHWNDEVSDIKNGKIRLEFIKGSYDNPKINAFALLKGDIAYVPHLPPVTDEMMPPVDADMAVFHDRISAVGNKEQTLRRQQQQQQQQETPEQHLKQLRPGAGNNKDDDIDLDDELEDFDDEQLQQQEQDQPAQLQGAKNERKTSGPRQPNPYAMDDSSVLLPVFIAIGAFIPLLFCLCKL